MFGLLLFVAFLVRGEAALKGDSGGGIGVRYAGCIPRQRRGCVEGLRPRHGQRQHKTVAFLARGEAALKGDCGCRLTPPTETVAFLARGEAALKEKKTVKRAGGA